MEKNKTGKYFKYAIGEIVLVVLGILIALQINNWNENRKERATEIKYLKNIKSDLQKELSNNAKFSDNLLRKSKASLYLLNIKEPTNLEDAQSYVTNYSIVFIRATYVPNNNAFKELLSSGKLNLISNDSIKNKLQEIDKDYANISLAENHIRREYEHYLYDIAISNISVAEMFDYSKPLGPKSRLSINDLPKNRQDKKIEDVKWLYNSEIFYNGIKLAHLANGGMTLRHSRLKEKIQELIDLINSEIKK